MKIAIMQPYFFPYIGYFQLINAVDKFVIYDNIEYTKKGWINRNRLIFDNKIQYFSINLKSDSDFLHINERRISKDYFVKDMPKILRKIEQYYSKAPYFKTVFSIIRNAFKNNEENLFNYIYYSLIQIINYLNINTEIVVCSDIDINHFLKKEEKVYEICNYFNADRYYNSIGGASLYSKDEFKTKGVNLSFMKTKEIFYKQNGIEWIANLSIIDVLMYNPKESIQEMLGQYELI